MDIFLLFEAKQIFMFSVLDKHLLTQLQQDTKENIMDIFLLFEAKQIFMFSVLDKHLLTDMGKLLLENKSVWKDFQEHMKSSSKGASEKRRLTQYVTNTILDDNDKGTTEQFVLHFNEKFRQLQEISDPAAHFPPQIKLQLLQNAVRPIND